MIQLLMKEKYELPSNERFIEILSKHLGKVEQYGSRKAGVKFAAHDYISEMKDASIPVTLMISDCEEFVRDSIDAFRRSQMWDCMSDRDRILSECKYQICLWIIWRHWWNYILSVRRFTTLTQES